LPLGSKKLNGLVNGLAEGLGVQRLVIGRERQGLRQDARYESQANENESVHGGVPSFQDGQGIPDGGRPLAGVDALLEWAGLGVCMGLGRLQADGEDFVPRGILLNPPASSNDVSPPDGNPPVLAARPIALPL
ncbi:MAG: hypothetical protein U1E05_21975, partial [Patescibacteria group bacterium]|nr:hypothetical protein [Patescibacteria group bacterium]